MAMYIVGIGEMLLNPNLNSVEVTRHDTRTVVTLPYYCMSTFLNPSL